MIVARIGAGQLLDGSITRQFLVTRVGRIPPDPLPLHYLLLSPAIVAACPYAYGPRSLPMKTRAAIALKMPAARTRPSRWRLEATGWTLAPAHAETVRKRYWRRRVGAASVEWCAPRLHLVRMTGCAPLLDWASLHIPDDAAA